MGEGKVSEKYALLKIVGKKVADILLLRF